jgi:WD40 repeat protein
LSNNSNFLATSSTDSSIRCYDIEHKSLKSKLSIYPHQSKTILFTNDCLYICIGSSDFTIRRWDFHSSNFLHILKEHSGAINSLQISADDKILISASNDCSVIAWNLPSKTSIFKFTGHTSWISCLALSSNCEFIVSGSEDKTLRMWDLQEFKQTHCFEAHSGEICTLQLSSDDRFALTGGQDCCIKVWDLKNKSLFYSHSKNLRFIQVAMFLADTNYIASASLVSIIIHNFKAKKVELEIEAHQNLITGLAYNSEKRVLISTSYDKTLKIWDINDSSVKISLEGHRSDVSCLCVSKCDKYIVAGSWDNSVTVWKLKEKKLIHRLLGHEHYVTCVTVTRDRKTVISGSWDKTLKIWDLNAGELLKNVKGYTEPIFIVIVSPKSGYFASSSADSQLRIWETESLDECFSHRFALPISRFEFTKDETSIVAVSVNNTINIIDIKKNTIKQAAMLESSIISMMLSHDNTYLLISMLNKIQLWDFKEMKPVCVFPCHCTLFQNNQITKDNEFIVGINKKTQLIVWNPRRNIEIIRFYGFSEVTVFTLTKCGYFIVAGYKNAEIKVWNIIEKREEVCFKGHTNEIICISLTKKDKFIISGGKDMSIKIWKMGEFMQLIMQNNSSYANDSLSQENLQQFKSSKIRNLANSSQLNSFNCVRKVYPALKFAGFCQRLSARLDPTEEDCKILLPNCVNLAHIYCYLGLYNLLRLALNQNCQIRKDGSGNSPLFYCLANESRKCIDVILEHMIKISRNVELSYKFMESNYALKDDLIKLLKINSSLVPQYLESIFKVIHNKSLPNTIKSFIPPRIVFSDQLRVSFDSFSIYNQKKHLKNEIFVKYRSTAFPLDLTKGSKSCFSLLKSLLHAPNQQVLTTKLIRTIINYKIKQFRVFVIFQSFMLWFKLLIMLFLIVNNNNPTSLVLIFLILTVLMLIHKLMQIYYEGFIIFIQYWKNILDIFTVAITFAWIILALYQIHSKLLGWMMVLLSFFKGLHGFSAFNRTRFYIRLIYRAIYDVYPFLFIFSYSTLAFGALYCTSIDFSISSFVALWKTPFELNLGSFDNDNVFSLEYLYFMLASMLNVIIMLNLLISILSDSFSQFKEEAVELDYIEKLALIIEIESVFLMKVGKGERGYFHLCEKEEKEKKRYGADKKINEISDKMNTLHADMGQICKKVEEGHKAMTEGFMRIEERMNKMQRQFEFLHH